MRLKPAKQLPEWLLAKMAKEMIEVPRERALLALERGQLKSDFPIGFIGDKWQVTER